MSACTICKERSLASGTYGMDADAMSQKTVCSHLTPQRLHLALFVSTKYRLVWLRLRSVQGQVMVQHLLVAHTLLLRRNGRHCLLVYRPLCRSVRAEPLAPVVFSWRSRCIQHDLVKVVCRAPALEVTVFCMTCVS